MINRLRSEAERVAAHQPPDVRGPWLAYNASLVDSLNELRLSQQEILRLIAGQNSAAAESIASAFREYAAGYELHHAATEAAALARDARQQAQIDALTLKRAADHAALHHHMDTQHTALLLEVAKLAGRQARLARPAPKELE